MRLDHLLSKEDGSEGPIGTGRYRGAGAKSDEGQKPRGKGWKTLFNLEGTRPWSEGRSVIRGCSSDGRAPALQAGGRQFESVHLHQGKEDGLIAQVVRARA